MKSENKISLKLKGRIFSLSHKEKLSKSMIGNSNYKNIDYKSKERSDKISKALSIPVFKYSLSGEFISKYESLKEASMKNNGISKSNINMVVNGKRKTCGGFIWKRN